MLLPFLLLVSLGSARTPLASYIHAADSAFQWDVTKKAFSELDLSLTSGKWHGTTWRHELVLIHPAHEDRRHAAILMITGDRVARRPDPDIVEAQDIAKRSHFPVAVLYQEPNQPIQGMREDDLIAWSFGKFLETGDPTWPALFPMTRAAFRAMDALQGATKSSANAIRRFIVVGESKRGWTTWLVGAVPDKRVIGIAPVSFDFLNFPAQLKRQVELWGKPSEMLASYTAAGLDKLVNSQSGKQLIELVDPYSYRKAFTAPTLIVRGSNDPYWATDAARFYIEGLPQRASMLVLPNEGHDFVRKEAYHATVAAFARSCTGAFTWPHRVDLALTHATNFAPSGADLVEIWGAGKGSLDFRPCRWSVGFRKQRGQPDETIEIVPDPLKPTAVFASFHWKIREKGGLSDQVTLTTIPTWSEPKAGS